MFAPLNTKTEYSFLDSVVKLDDYLEGALRLGYKTVGICDVGNLHAAFRFVRKAQMLNLQPVISIELNFEWRGLPVSFSFIAKNTEGYKNLLRISTFHNYDRRQFSDIQNHLSGIALVIPETYGALSELSELAAFADEAYIGIDQQTDKGTKFNLPTLPFPAVRYLNFADNEILAILHAVRDGLSFDESLTVSSNELLQRPEAYESYFQKYFPQALTNLSVLTAKIAYPFDEKLELPRFDKKREAVEHLREEAILGLSARLEEKKSLTGISSVSLANALAEESTMIDLSVYQERLEKELSVIHQMGFDDYFLIVADLLRYAREQDIYCGMGRGSAAGSLVAYVLGITQVDPVKHNLFFERFLNPERVAMPDIDIDMPDDRRAELLAYMKNRYGSDHVAQIVTFSTLGKRQALRDVGKAFGMTEAELSNLTRMLVRRFGTLADEYENNQRFKAEVLKNGKLKRIYEVARRIEGMPRQTSTHASGVVLSEESLVNYVSLKPSEDLALTQYEAPDVEAIGLLKIDFLGLRNLTIISRLRDLVKKRQKIDIDPLKIDLEDEATLALFRAGNTMGIFQFENPQMRRFLRNLAPSKFDDIVDATSIFRPGPSQFIPQFVARRHGKEIVPVVDDSISEILKPTYGIMIYQEQIMQVAQAFAGFSLGKADLLRRAISKKKGSELEKLREDFLISAGEMGHSKEKAEEIYDLIERFANYGFNRSHGFAYGALAFQIAYFKAHFPDEFYEIQLRDRKREVMILDALDNGFEIEKPNINQMKIGDFVKNKKIRLGLAHVQGISRDLAKWIVENQSYKNLADFVEKLPNNFHKKESILPLIQIGAFDYADSNRGKLAYNLADHANLLNYYSDDIFMASSGGGFAYHEAEDYSETEKYDFEKNLLGIGVTPHPLQSLAQRFSGNFTPIANLVKNSRMTILVEINYIRTHRTKTGQTMAFLTVSDSRENFDVTLFPEIYRQFSSELEQGKFYLISGKVTERNDELQLVADRMSPALETDKKLWLNLRDEKYNQKISQILCEFPGSHQVILHYSNLKKTIQTKIYVEESEFLKKRLEGYVIGIVYK
ncbi:DNA polymerase III catalytic subunit, DnaE type [Lactococcus cremoris subsp. cremoris SK11]|uniref:DNA polymerase III subunit alpha n=2 Tax=Lactococcus lactis subsp. cremoris TaxID=1359 RepID=Q031K6_LACLS|nr:DNA polymerase III subunit alpha [Lactococcus cremoris]ABJ72116.1 DNA polymerase III catalytic subunit, DnaE type [Lactococcus cremoris subsp. cremoris SK11]ARE22714.1 DNA polymerase III subunit alpha [Lactococcus cremoris]KZK44671.1 DNA polymerase III alpha subunit [Lactococcus cremoris]KZK53294.1 DNA polymerase III alpha subunit [Lactococcus cremoris]MCT4409611.1 DNA polymerase III subunit alpha [Lactococcus cremoris]